MLRLKPRGFHLLEVLIVLALFAVMSQWVLASHEQELALARRKEAAAALYALAAALEDYAFANRGYNGASLAQLKIKSLTSGEFYELQIVDARMDRYIIAAHPRKRQATLDTECGTLTLTSTGEKRAGGKHNHHCF
jgi:prepilin-type N-terminal cleavage/methylation domain-containing protein